VDICEAPRWSCELVGSGDIMWWRERMYTARMSTGDSCVLRCAVLGVPSSSMNPSPQSYTPWYTPTTPPVRLCVRTPSFTVSGSQILAALRLAALAGKACGEGFQRVG
jgi:hypothetical protein